MPFRAERYSGLAGFRYALRRFLAASEKICGSAGVTSKQYQTLLVLGCSAEPLSIKELAQHLLLKHHSAVQLVDRLCSAGLVQRLSLRGDARVAIVELTTKGEKILESLAELHLREMLKQEPMLSEALVILKKASIEKR